MRILEALAAGHPLKPAVNQEMWEEWSQTPPAETRAAFEENAAQLEKMRSAVSTHAVPVQADAAWTWYWATDTDWKYGDVTVGVIRLPFEFMIFEGRIPNRLWVDGRWKQRAPNGWKRTACIMREGTASTGELFISCAYLAWTGARSDPILHIPAESRAVVGNDGAWRHDRMITATHSSLAGVEHTFLVPALFSVGLMNCKNVKVTQHPVPAKVRRKREKTGKPSIDWNVIELPSDASSARTVGALRESVGGVAPMHLVRGHFKTYTEDAPLMGKHVGTYWWGSQVRGSSENGVRLHDYQISGDAA